MSLVALLASILTFFSGFGLGTLLMPVVAVFFPLEIAIGITAIVHLANNLFKVILIGKKASSEVLLRFGIAAVPAAFLGAFTLGWLSDVPPIISYSVLGRQMDVLPLKLVVGLLILCFVYLELSAKLSVITINKKYLPLGGAVSGFFGGLSGQVRIRHPIIFRLSGRKS